jgi:hypothetical protein
MRKIVGTGMPLHAKLPDLGMAKFGMIQSLPVLVALCVVRFETSVCMLEA